MSHIERTGAWPPSQKKLDQKYDKQSVVGLGRHRKPCEDRILPMSEVILVILTMCVRGRGGGGGTGHGGGWLLMAVSCGRMADRGWKASVLGALGRGPDKVRGQTRGKYFSINFFTSAISCSEQDRGSTREKNNANIG